MDWVEFWLGFFSQCLISFFNYQRSKQMLDLKYSIIIKTNYKNVVSLKYVFLLWFYLPNQMDVPMELQRISLSVNPIEEFLEAPQN